MEFLDGQRGPEMCRRRFVKLLQQDKDKDSEQKEIEELYKTNTELKGKIVQLERTNEELQLERSKDEGARKRNCMIYDKRKLHLR